jgi:hypothetical protein
MRVQRFDRSEPLDKPETTQEGYLRLDGKIARTGIQVYRRADGTEIREYRSPDAVFDAAYLRSLEGIPLTNQHPQGLLHSGNAKHHAVGAVAGVRKLDSKWLGARMTVWDDNAKQAIQSGRAQLSVGYTAEVVDEPGEIDGEKYDAVQRNIQANHLALCDFARAGKEACLRLDDTGNEVRFWESTESMATSNNQEPAMQTIKIDGCELKTEDPNGQTIVDKALAKARQDGVTEGRAEVKAQSDRADSAELKLKTAESKLKEHLDGLDKLVEERAKERADAIDVAKKYLGANYEMAGGPSDWLIAIAQKAFAKSDSDKAKIAKLDGMALKDLAEKAQAVLDLTKETLPKVGAHSDSSPEAARQRMIERNRAAQVK